MTSPSDPAALRTRLQRLGLFGVLSHIDELEQKPWLTTLLELEEEERHRRSLERRMKNARIGRMKPMADFDWTWPKKVDRGQTEDLFRRRFLAEKSNIVLLGPNGVGKTMIAQNLAHQAVLQGYSARVVMASDLLKDLASQEGARGLHNRLRAYVRPQLLVIDELGYLAHGANDAALLFEIVTRRYQERSIVLTTNKPFAEWNQLFPNAGCVVTLIDRLLHHSEIVQIEGESYRLKEAKERAAKRRRRKS